MGVQNRPTDVLSLPTYPRISPGIFRGLVTSDYGTNVPDEIINEMMNLGDIIICEDYVRAVMKWDEEGVDELGLGFEDVYAPGGWVGNSPKGEGGIKHGCAARMEGCYDYDVRLRLLCLHGILHLIGFDHVGEESGGRGWMEDMEEKICREVKEVMGDFRMSTTLV